MLDWPFNTNAYQSFATEDEWENILEEFKQSFIVLPLAVGTFLCGMRFSVKRSTRKVYDIASVVYTGFLHVNVQTQTDVSSCLCRLSVHIPLVSATPRHQEPSSRMQSGDQYGGKRLTEGLVADI